MAFSTTSKLVRSSTTGCTTSALLKRSTSWLVIGPSLECATGCEASLVRRHVPHTGLLANFDGTTVPSTLQAGAWPVDALWGWFACLPRGSLAAKSQGRNLGSEWYMGHLRCVNKGRGVLEREISLTSAGIRSTDEMARRTPGEKRGERHGTA